VIFNNFVEQTALFPSDMDWEAGSAAFDAANRLETITGDPVGIIGSP